MKRYGTVFPDNVNFTGWWELSPTGIIGQLEKTRFKHAPLLDEDDERTNDPDDGIVIYRIWFHNGLVPVGNGEYTTAMLQKDGCIFRLTLKEIEDEVRRREKIPSTTPSTKPEPEPATAPARQKRFIHRRK